VGRAPIDKRSEIVSDVWPLGFISRRRKLAAVANVLYVHLRSDGGIYVVRGSDGSGECVTEAALRDELGHIRAIQGEVLLTLGAPEGELPAYVKRLYDAIRASGLPLTMARTPHPIAAKRLDGGATTLIAAAIVGDDGLVDDLVRRGVPLEDQDDFGYTALMMAANRGHTRIADCLLDHGADANAVDRDRSTPLMFAAQHGHDEIVRLLLRAGADRAARGDHGFTALDFARQNRKDTTLAILEGAGAPS